MKNLLASVLCAIAASFDAAAFAQTGSSWYLGLAVFCGFLALLNLALMSAS